MNNPLGFIDPFGLVNQSWKSRGRNPAAVGKGGGSKVGTFGCVGFHCVSGNTSGARWRLGPPSFGGGIQICTKDQEPTSCEDKNKAKKNNNIYPVGNGNRGFTYGKFGLGVEVWENGVVCVSVGFQAGFPGPVVDGGDAMP